MKQKRLLILFVAVAVLAVGLGVFFYGRYEVINHAKHMSKSELLAYNSAMTARGHTAGWITQDMVLVLNDLHKDRQNIEFLESCFPPSKSYYGDRCQMG